MSGLYWREPLWLLAALYPLCLAAWARWRQRRVRVGYADPALWPWLRVGGGPGQRRWAAADGLQRLGLTGAWLLLVGALAGPRLPLEVPEGARPPPGALLAVLDLSRSMEVRDLQGSRRAAAGRLLQAWNATPGRPPLGLVIYAGRAHLYFPPSPDPDAVGYFLEQLPGLQLPTLGNDLAGALTLAAQRLAQVPGHRALVLLSDGDLDDAARARALTALRDWPQPAPQFSVVGVGSSTATGVPDPQRGWLTVEGRPVVSRLEAGWLQELAAAGGGRYRAAAEPVPITELWQAPALRIAAADHDQVLWRELYPWLLAPALLLLALTLLAPAGRALALGAVAVLGLGLVPAPLPAATAEQAHAALQAGQYAEARTLYGRLPGYAGRFGEGSACFRLEQWSCAAEAFAAAAWLAGNDEERGRAAYNLGSTRYRQGDYAAAAVLYRDAQAHGLAQPQLEALIGLAEQLSAQVEQRRREQAGARQRAGSGPRTVGGDLLDVVAAQRGLEQAPPPPAPLPQGLDHGGFEALVGRGLERARLSEAAGGAAGDGPRAWFGGEDVAGQRPGTELWQRLFEIEEGFPAPLAAPRPRPPERPW